IYSDQQRPADQSTNCERRLCLTVTRSGLEDPMRSKRPARLFAIVALTAAAVTTHRLSAETVTGATPAPQAEYVFVQDTERYVAIDRGNAELIGNLDANGNFTLRMKYIKGHFYSGPQYEVINSTGGKPKPAYEFRSGRLIKGELDK